MTSVKNVLMRSGRCEHTGKLISNINAANVTEFRYIDTKIKHVKRHHENLRIYCHYFNNKKTCPHGDNCVFLHSDSGDCRYGRLCERMFCMFKHECEDLDNSEIIEDEIVKNDEAINIVDVDDVSVTDDSVNDQEHPNKTFMNPSQADKSSISEQFKC